MMFGYKHFHHYGEQSFQAVENRWMGGCIITFIKWWKTYFLYLIFVDSDFSITHHSRKKSGYLAEVRKQNSLHDYN